MTAKTNSSRVTAFNVTIEGKRVAGFTTWRLPKAWPVFWSVSLTALKVIYSEIWSNGSSEKAVEYSMRCLMLAASPSALPP